MRSDKLNSKRQTNKNQKLNVSKETISLKCKRKNEKFGQRAYFQTEDVNN